MGMPAWLVAAPKTVRESCRAMPPEAVPPAAKLSMSHLCVKY